MIRKGKKRHDNGSIKSDQGYDTTTKLSNGFNDKNSSVMVKSDIETGLWTTPPIDLTDILNLVMPWLTTKEIIKSLTQVCTSIHSTLRCNQMFWKNSFSRRFAGTKILDEMLRLENMNNFDVLGLQWFEAYKKVVVEVVRNKNWFKHPLRKNDLIEISTIPVHAKGQRKLEVGGLSNGRLICIDRNARKLLAIKISHCSEVYAQQEIEINPSVLSPIRAVNDNHALLLTTEQEPFLLRLFDISDLIACQSFTPPSALLSLGDVEILKCCMTEKIVVACVCHGKGTFLFSWELLTGAHIANLQLSCKPLQAIEMAMHQNTIRLVLQNMETFVAPWADSNELSRGQWILSARADNLQVLHYHCHQSNYDYYGILSFCAEGRYLVTGTERSGPYIFEDINFHSTCRKFKYKMVNEGEDYGMNFGDSPKHASGVHGMIVTDMRSWWQSDLQTTFITVVNMNPRHGRDLCDDDPDFIDWVDLILWGEIDEEKTEDVADVFASDGIIVASSTKYHPFDSEADSSSDSSLKGQDEGLSNIRIWDLTVSSTAGAQEIISELKP